MEKKKKAFIKVTDQEPFSDEFLKEAANYAVSMSLSSIAAVLEDGYKEIFNDRLPVDDEQKPDKEKHTLTKREKEIRDKYVRQYFNGETDY